MTGRPRATWARWTRSPRRGNSRRRLTVPVTASAVKSVSLTVTGSTAHLAKAPKASATVSITAPPSAPPTRTAAVERRRQQRNPADDPPVPDTVTSPLPVGSLPGIPAVSPTLSPGGNAADLFPTLDPTPTASPTQSAPKARTRPVADTSALPEGAPVVGAQLAGLAALALAFVLAVTRLSIRRRPAATPPAQGHIQRPRQTQNNRAVSRPRKQPKTPRPRTRTKGLSTKRPANAN